MLAAVGLQDEPDPGLADVEVDPLADVDDVEHVGAGRRRPRRAAARAPRAGRGRRSRTPAAAPPTVSPSRMHSTSRVASTLPPESTAQISPSARRLDLAGEQRRDRGRAGALDDQLRALEQEHHRLGDLVVGDRDDLVEVGGEQRPRQLAGLLDRDPVADRPRGAALGDDADHAPLRAPRLERDRDPGRQRRRRRSATTTVVVAGACSAISSPTVPWPAITTGSSKAGSGSGPRARRPRAPAAAASS